MHPLPGSYHYHRIGHDERELELLPDGRIGTGASAAERRWMFANGQQEGCLVIAGDYGPICKLHLDPDGCWRGQWLKFEQMPIELVPQRLQALRSLENREGIRYIPGRFHYISYVKLVSDCHELARRLTNVRAVAGVPRSGMIPASLIALDLNVPMIDLQVLIDSEQPEIPLPRRGFGNRVCAGEILVVDDTCASGRQVDRLRQLIRAQVKYVAVYVEDRPVIRVDYFHSKLPDFAQFYEWTMFHDVNNGLLLTDLDGVLCDDWKGGNEDEHAAEYQAFLANVRPRRIPTQPLRGIVTNRLERHRPETEAWLKEYGIQYERLMMSPHPTFAIRDKASDSAARKAAIYQQDESALIFVESDDMQAREIARRTGRPVFSVARNGLV